MIEVLGVIICDNLNKIYAKSINQGAEYQLILMNLANFNF